MDMNEAESDPYETTMQESKVRLGRFQVLRHHARGGLGQIEIALDQQFKREIALKSIREEHSGSELHQEKFNQEAMVTGALEHPGVVPVYAFGRDEDGSLFYAMRFIRGEEFATKIKTFHQNVRSGIEPAMGAGQRFLIRKLIDVCHTISYAHSRGVVHRDLKPANIMLGPYGETLVVDWGLAKPLGSAPEVAPQSPKAPSNQSAMPLDSPVSRSFGSETQAGQTIGTIIYAPPEQLTGQVSEIDYRSDIYSLGVILFEALLGEAPIKFMESGISLANFTNAVINGRVPTPRQCSSSIPKALDAVCCKAMRPVRQDRYQTVDAFRLDLERWMDGLAVSVHPESFGERASRWMRDHIALVRAASISLLVVSIVCLVAMWTINKAKLQQESAKQEATQLLRIARETTDQLLQNTSDQLEDLPGATQVRLDLLGKAADSFKRIAAVKTSDPELLRESAAAFVGLATVQRMLDQRTDAIASLENAISTFKSIPTTRLPDAGDSVSVAKAQIELSRVLSDDANSAGAKKAIDEAFESIQGFSDSPTDMGRQRLVKGMALIHKGVLSLDAGDSLAAMESNVHTKEVLRDSLRLVEMDAKQAEWAAPMRLQLARSLINETRYLSREDAAASEVKSLVRAAIQQLEWIIQRDPKNREAIKTYALALNNQAQYESERNNFAAATASYKSALTFAEKLQDEQSEVLEYRNLATLAHLGLGGTATASDDIEAAKTHYEQAFTVAADLLQRNKSSLRFRVSFALAAFHHASMLPSSEYAMKLQVLTQAANALEMNEAKRLELLKEAGDEGLMEQVRGALNDSELDKLIDKLRIGESEGLVSRLKEFIVSTESFQSSRMYFNSACKISQCCQVLESNQVMMGAELDVFANEALRRLKQAILEENALFGAAKEDLDFDFLRRTRGEEFSKMRPE